MARILICSDNVASDEQARKVYEEELHPSLIQAGHEVQLTTCAQAFDYLDNYSADILLMFVPERSSPCWETARFIRTSWSHDSPPPSILMSITWGPDDSPEDPAYYVQPEYRALYDDYQRGVWRLSDLIEWINGFIAAQQK